MIVCVFVFVLVVNVVVGFDILGYVIVGVGDMVSVWCIDELVVCIEVICGSVVELLLEVVGNIVGVVLMLLCVGLDLDFGFVVEIDKGILFGLGMGGLVVLCVVVLVVVNVLLDVLFLCEVLYLFVLDGEVVVSGGCYGDNVGLLLFGGLVLCMVDCLLLIFVLVSWYSLLVYLYVVLEICLVC